MTVFPKGIITPQLYRIGDIAGKHADLNPISLGAVPMQTPLTDLRRYRIRTTDEVSWNNRIARVVRIVNPLDEDVYRYEIELEEGGEQVVPEYELSVHEGSLAADPAEMLAQLDIAPWRLVDARARLLSAYFAATQRSMGIVGYNGARMLPIPHQINAARYALQFGRIRFLLADEVGLGKTIEAGLIVSTLRKYFPDWDTAIFVPESLTAQWAFEMYGKFGKMVFALDEDMIDEEEGEESGVILPHHRAPSYAKQATPEILVVDEAHRILHQPAIVKALRDMSRKAHVVLLLTATPVSDDAMNLLNLLQVLDPEEFKDLNDPDHMRELQEAAGRIEELLHAVRQSPPDHDAALAAWKATGLKDREIEKHLKEAQDNRHGRHEMHQTASLVIDRYYPGARMLRYRRKFLAEDNPLPFRVVAPIEYKPMAEEEAVAALMTEWLGLYRQAELSDSPEAQRIAAALIRAVFSSPLAVADWIAARRGDLEEREGVTADAVRLSLQAMEDLKPVKGEKALLDKLEEANRRWQRAAKAVDATSRQLAESPRYKAFLQFLKDSFDEEPDAHILVFTSFESNVHPLYLLLRKALTDIAEVYEMSGLQTRIEREKNAFEFQEFPSGSVLISDDLGGEGRNFQFASHVVHWDLPLAPWLVEQRIGRCDRVGRDEEMDVDSQVLVAKGQLDEAFFDFLCDGVGVFNDSIAPVEAELDRVMAGTMQACIDEGASGVLDRIDEVAELLEEARERENADLLVRGAVGVEEARRISTELHDEAELLELRHRVIDYARLFESMVDEREGGRVAITVGDFHSLHGVPGVRREMIGYFDRREAVRHERLDFFSPGHPFVRSLAQMAMVESPDRTAVVRRAGVKKPALLCTFRISIPPEFIAAVRQMPVDLRPPLLSKSAYLFGTRMVRVAVDSEGAYIQPDGDGAIYYAERTAEDVSLDASPDLADLLPADWANKVYDLAGAALEKAEELEEQTLTARRAEFEDLVCEALTRVDPKKQLKDSDVEAIVSHFETLTIDLDSAVWFVK